MTSISYVDLSQHWAEEKNDLIPIINEVMSGGVFVGGSYIETFEQGCRLHWC